MPKWGVTLPVSGQVYVEVEADDKRAAIEAALDVDPDVYRDTLEWETHRQVCRGNVFGGMLNTAEAEEL